MNGKLLGLLFLTLLVTSCSFIPEESKAPAARPTSKPVDDFIRREPTPEARAIKPPSREAVFTYPRPNEAGEKPRLTGIIKGATLLAVIEDNGKSSIVKQGERCGIYTLNKIMNDCAVLSYGYGSYKIYLEDSNAK